MPSDHVARGIVHKITAFIGRRSEALTSRGAGEMEPDFDAIIEPLDTGIAAHRRDMAQRLESLNRSTA